MVKKTTKMVLWGVGIVLTLMVLGVLTTPVALQGVIGGVKGFLPELAVSGGSGAAGAGAAAADTTTGMALLVTDSLQTKMTEMYSESPTASNGGQVLVFDAGVDPADPSAVTYATLTLGTAYTTANIQCGQKYTLAYDNGTAAYALVKKDVVLIDCATEYNRETADSFVDFTAKYGWKREVVATLDDMFDETSTDGRMNGNTNTSITLSTNEIGCTTNCSVDGTLIYDVSQGDGTYYIDITPGASGANSDLQKPVLCFRWDVTNPPEGNEISDLVVQHRTGSVFSGINSGVNWEDIFANEECVQLDSVMKSGTSGTYRFTFTYNEANVGANDDFFLDFDDLGANRGKDARLNLGATRDTITFDAQA